MRFHYILVLILSLLFSQINPGAGLLTGLGHRSDHYMCVRNGGFCLYSSCPVDTKITGTCYHGRAKCCS
uniref:Beta-defensin 1 n=2 Tax=Marmota marmota marmota TaxID=9994 RepID=A0A8C6ABE8_MARMA